MRLLQALSFGTERYPEKVARRLRLINLACWSVAPVWLGFAAAWLEFAPASASDAKLRTVVAISGAAGIIIAGIPWLHRVGPLAAGMAFAAVSYLATFAVCLLGGTDSGMNIHYLGYAAGAVLVFGVDPIKPSLIVGAWALAFVIAIRILAPHDG
jgi:adenylate cyclase